MYQHPANNPAYQSYHSIPPLPAYVRAPPGPNASQEVPLPPPSMSQPLTSQNPSATTSLEANQRRVQVIIDAMNQGTEQLKIDKNYQTILLAHGLLYTACPNAWISCDCEFCAGVRHVRQYDGLDAIGHRLWNDPQYSFWREYPGIHGLKECECDRCTGKIKDKVPDNLAPDWNLWYDDREGGSINKSSNFPQPGPSFDKMVQKISNFAKEQVEYQGKDFNTLKSNFMPDGTHKPLFEMSESEMQKYQNYNMQYASNGASSVSANFPHHQFRGLQPSPLPDPGPPIDPHRGFIGQPYTNGNGYPPVPGFGHHGFPP